MIIAAGRYEIGKKVVAVPEFDETSCHAATKCQMTIENIARSVIW